MQAANSIWRRQIKLTLLLAWAGCWHVQAADLEFTVQTLSGKLATLVENCVRCGRSFLENLCLRTQIKDKLNWKLMCIAFSLSQATIISSGMRVKKMMRYAILLPQ